MSISTANVISQMLHAAVRGAPDPVVGMGVTVCWYTDRTVGTITEVVSPTHIVFTSDRTVPNPAIPVEIGHQNWVHTPDPDGSKRHAMKHRNGRWYLAKASKLGTYTVSKKSTPIAVGRRDYYYDWSF